MTQNCSTPIPGPPRTCRTLVEHWLHSLERRLGPSQTIQFLWSTNPKAFIFLFSALVSSKGEGKQSPTCCGGVRTNSEQRRPREPGRGGSALGTARSTPPLSKARCGVSQTLRGSALQPSSNGSPTPTQYLTKAQGPRTTRTHRVGGDNGWASRPVFQVLFDKGLLPNYRRAYTESM